MPAWGVGADRVVVLEELAGRGQLTEELEAELVELRPKVTEWKQKKRKRDTTEYQAITAAADRVVVLEELAGRGQLTEELEAELVELRPKVTEWKQKKRKRDTTEYQAITAAADRVVVLEELAGRGQLTEELEAELVELRPKVTEWKQKKRKRDTTEYQAITAAADRVVVLEELAGRGQLTEELEAELVELRPKVTEWKQKKRKRDTTEYQAITAAADRVVVLEELAGRGQLTEELEAELVELRPKVTEWKQKKRKRDTTEYQAITAAADRVVVLEELAGRGQLTEELEAELVELRPKVTEWKQKKRKRDTTEYQAITAAADRVVVLEELAGRGQLTEELEAELVELRPKVTEWKQKKRKRDTTEYQAITAAADRVVVLEELAGRGQLTEELEAELVELRPKVTEWKQKKRKRDTTEYQAITAAADRVVVLEELAGRGQLTEELEAELVELRPKVTEWKQKKRKRDTTEYQAITAAADRVVVLEELAGRGQLTEELEAELAELRPKAERKMQKTERDAKARWRRRAEAVRVAELEELEGWGPLTEEQAAELAALRLKVAGRRRKNKDRDVMDTGASGAPLAGRDERIAGPEGASEWAVRGLIRRWRIQQCRGIRVQRMLGRRWARVLMRSLSRTS
ncbi:hypothetical protein [Saccharopolyspora spinosa]|uniref:hypothetical protein n=1 Tax=Saccharopolyspora spinosa TaxID=60894 RepID=UPI00178C79E2|nr:hypothetical protein [Saccharopolyspora spinosa]